MKKMFAVIVAMVLIALTPSGYAAFQRGDGFVVCGASCHYPHMCFIDTPRPAYCYYDVIVDTCFDGAYDPTCDTVPRF